MPHCDDFTRTDSARRGGLESPISRRRLLQAGIGATFSLYAARAMPFARALEAGEAAAASAPNAPVLVSVFIPGGLDLLDTLVPTASYGRYADLRKSARVDAPLELAGAGVGVHPALGQGLNGGLKGLFERGDLGFIPGIDYANPDLSHFNSRHFWETGEIKADAGAGWLARWNDRHGDSENPFQALSIDYDLSPTLRGSRNPAAAVTSPSNAQAYVPGVYGKWEDRYLAHHRKLAAPKPSAPGRAAVYAAARQQLRVAQTLRPYVPDDDKKTDPLAPPVEYPRAPDNDQIEDFADNLRHLAAMITLPLGIRVATVEAPGDFDTHDDQKASLAKDLVRVCAALAAFQADLEARGVASRVLTLVWTEFGRRPEGNSSGGTDHGAGGIAWLMGPRARGGLLSPYPDLTAFDREDNLKVTMDFRTVYASLLEQWLGTGADEVLPDAGKVGRLQLVT